MTLAKVHNPISPIDPGALDWYLSNGWFRMGQTIFTTHILHYDQKFYSAVWLRVPLENLSESKTLKKLKKLNSDFRIIIQTASLTKEKEQLFEQYKASVPFEASSSLENLLYGKLFPLNIYHTLEVCLYDHEKLIGVGFFDMGKETAAGISSFYDPSYKKNSLGKYLIYLKIEYCRLLGLQYFYPGYFVPGYSMFDYKLEIARASLEYYSLAHKSWLPIQQFSHSTAPLEEMRTKLSSLKELMRSRRISSLLLYYEFYNVNLAPEFKDLQLFDFPLFLYCAMT
jgi:leucyl-tRNA---protein transferase